MILSLQGCMAVGKTTAARYLEQHCQQVQVCFEDNAAVLAEIKQRGLNKNSYAVSYTHLTLPTILRV